MANKREIVEHKEFNKAMAGWDAEFAAEQAFWRGEVNMDNEPYQLRLIERPDRWCMEVYVEHVPIVRGEKRYGAMTVKAESDGYLGFGGHVVRRHEKYLIYCIGATDATWQYYRLSSGMCSMGIDPNKYTSWEEVEAVQQIMWPEPTTEA